MANHSSILALKTHEQHKEAKRYDTRRRAPQVGRCPICYWGIASERIKRLGRSGNPAQLWTCLVVKVESDAIKSNVA